jgi:hypothetical protein
MPGRRAGPQRARRAHLCECRTRGLSSTTHQSLQPENSRLQAAPLERAQASRAALRTVANELLIACEGRGPLRGLFAIA